MLQVTIREKSGLKLIGCFCIVKKSMYQKDFFSHNMTDYHG